MTKMADFTEKQLAVINYTRGNLVVSASAGSGKTSVMVERLIRLITEEGVSVKDILCVTFTRLAATEMRDRLSKALIRKINETSDEAVRKRLKKELSYIPIASISTIDSFLNSLIKKYFYLVGVDSTFTIAADSDEKTLKTTALNDVLERLYSENDDDITCLLSVFIQRRKDENLRKKILLIHGFLESESDGAAFLKNAINMYSEDGLKTVENRLIDGFLAELDSLLPSVNEVYIRAKQVGEKKIADCLGNISSAITDAKKRRTVEGLFAFADRIIKKPSRPGGKNADHNLTLWDDFDALYASLKSVRDKINGIFYDRDFSVRLQGSVLSGDILKRLINVVQLFGKEYTALKREQNVLDYADLSHIGYDLLKREEVISDIRGTYKFIFVDEYQDTNGIQESIFRLLENSNLFVVGDIKQSIYGFRGCRADNFRARADKAKSSVEFIELDKNFRSAPAVIEAVNKIFSVSMTESTSGLSYADSPMVYGGLYGDYAGEAELFYTDLKFFKNSRKENPVTDPGVYSVEKHLNAEKFQDISYEKLIVRLVRKALSKEIYDVKTGKRRLCTYGDIAILHRTVKSGVDRVCKELDMANIPVVAENKRNIKSYPEIQMLLNILKCVLSVNDDIALATALKSPVGNLSDYELKVIHDSDTAVTFHEAVLKASSGTGALGKKLKDFFDYIRRIRLFSAYEGVPTLIRRIMREKSFETKLLSSGGGEFKLKRIGVFISHGYVGDRERYLEEFMSDIESLLDSMTVPSGGALNAVHVMSIHASKGLEFPVVIVAGVNNNWNKQDSSEELLCAHGDNGGIGIYTYNFPTKHTSDGVVKSYIKNIKYRENMQEEMRLLYVALTRARCILYIASKQEPDESCGTGVATANTQLKLIPQAAIKCTFIPPEEVLETSFKDDLRQFILPEADRNLIGRIKEFTGFSYPYEKDTLLSLKRTVTEVNRGVPLSDEDEPFVKPVFQEKRDDKEEKSFIRGNLTAADVGTAYHKFLELVDFDKINDNGLIYSLLKQNFTDEEIKVISVDKIKCILKLEIFNEIKGYKLYKEQPFIVTVPPALAGESGTEDILLQGTIDLLCISGDKAIIVDYKHSHRGAEEIKTTYCKQLDLYKYAVEKALKVKVVKKVIVNLYTATQIMLD